MRRSALLISTLAALLLASLLVLYFALSAFLSPQQHQSATTTPTPTAAVPVKAFKFVPLDTPRPPPDLAFVDGGGHALTLADFRGRFVLLNIWATWCVPCREEMPSLDRLQRQLGSQAFQVVPLSIDREGIPAVKRFYEELGLKSLDIYADQSGKASRDLNVIGIPTTLLVDREGREIGRTIGPAEWDSPDVVAVIRRYLGEPSAGLAPESVGAEAAARSTGNGRQP